MQKWMYAVIAIVAVVAVVGVVLGVRYLAPEWPHGGNGVPNGDGNGVPNGGQTNGRDIADATSLSFRMKLTNGDIGDFTWLVKDIGTDDLKLRIEGLLGDINVGSIINGDLQRGWELQNDEWMEMPSEAWADSWDGYLTDLDVIMGELEGWTQGDRTYFDADWGYSVRIYNIEVDPDLADALFAP